MNKQAIITILLAIVAMTGQAQEIKKVAATPEDFMEHMALCGYEVFTFDISSLRDSVSGFTIVIREYNQQGMIDEKKLYGFRTKTMISDSPVQSDSIETITLRSSRNDASPWKLTLKPIPGAPQTVYRYQKAPYQPTSFSLDTFIPLVFYGSFWWDEQAKGWRFCGETELTEEKAKTSDYFKFCPHYYIIGAIFHK